MEKSPAEQEARNAYDYACEHLDEPIYPAVKLDLPVPRLGTQTCGLVARDPNQPKTTIDLEILRGKDTVTVQFTTRAAEANSEKSAKDLAKLVQGILAKL